MTTVLKVLKFDENRLASRCKVIATDEDPSSLIYVGKEMYVDLTVDAGFGDMPESELVGKTVTVEKFQAHEYIGVGVKLAINAEVL